MSLFVWLLGFAVVGITSWWTGLRLHNAQPTDVYAVRYSERAGDIFCDGYAEWFVHVPARIPEWDWPAMEAYLTKIEASMPHLERHV